MSLDKADFFPDNVEFIGFIGAWGCYVGVDTVETLFYLIRTKDLDWLEEVAKHSSTVMSNHCVAGVSRQGSTREAAAWLLNAHIRSRVLFECPVGPYKSGLLSGGELKTIVETVAEELKRNSRVAEEKQQANEAPIISLARDLGLNPRPAGHNDTAWMADCPRTNHWLMISATENTFGCGWCKRKGGAAELRSFYERTLLSQAGGINAP